MLKRILGGIALMLGLIVAPPRGDAQKPAKAKAARNHHSQQQAQQVVRDHELAGCRYALAKHDALRIAAMLPQ